jgi:hypothetical protein
MDFSVVFENVSVGVGEVEARGWFLCLPSQLVETGGWRRGASRLVACGRFGVLS